MNIEIMAIEVKQPIGTFYVCKLQSEKLIEMSNVDILKITSGKGTLYSGVQRPLKREKVIQIVEYLKSYDATFPNSIIVNVDKDHFQGFCNGYLTLTDDKTTFTILDGQHRIEGLKESNNKGFEVVLSIFVGLEKNDQSKVFVTINTEQTKVDPSHALYQEVFNVYNTPEKMVVKLSEMFAIDKRSPWCNLLKLKGVRDELASDGILSLSAFAKPIISNIYDNENQFRSTIMFSIIPKNNTYITANNS